MGALVGQLLLVVRCTVAMVLLDADAAPLHEQQQLQRCPADSTTLTPRLHCRLRHKRDQSQAMSMSE